MRAVTISISRRDTALTRALALFNDDVRSESTGRSSMPEAPRYRRLYVPEFPPSENCAKIARGGSKVFPRRDEARGNRPTTACPREAKRRNGRDAPLEREEHSDSIPILSPTLLSCPSSLAREEPGREKRFYEGGRSSPLETRRCRVFLKADIPSRCFDPRTETSPKERSRVRRPSRMTKTGRSMCI